MAELTDELLNQMVDTIVREVQPRYVYLFGSRARGDAREDSDADFLVVDSGEFGPGRERSLETVRLYRALATYPIDVDVLMYTVPEFEYRRTGRNNVVARAVREGRVVYERP